MAERTGVETREAQILGALSAGFGWLSGEPMDERPLLTRQETDFEEQTPNIAPLAAVLALTERLETGAHMTIAEMLYHGWSGPDGTIMKTRHYGDGEGSGIAREAASRLGFRFLDGWLMVAVKYQPIKQLLKKTAYADHDFDRVIFGLPGVKRHTTRVKFGAIRRVAAKIPHEMVEELGVFGNET